MKWIDQCSSGWIQKDDYFEFNLKKGIPGECPQDHLPLKGTYEFKERQEVRSDYLTPGTYIWSADIETISDKIIHAKQFSLFQIHDHRKGGRPPHSLIVKRGNLCFATDKDYTHDFFVSKYTGKVSVKVKFYITKEIIIADYTIDNKKIRKMRSKIKSVPFVKFGAYRWNAVCDVKQIYRNLRFEKL